MKNITVEAVVDNTTTIVWEGTSILQAMKVARKLPHAIIRRGGGMWEYRAGHLWMWNEPLLA